MGDRGAANEAPTADDIAAMSEIVERGLQRRCARVLDLAHADPQVEVRRAGSRHPCDRRRAVRHRRRAAPSRPRRVPVRSRSCARPPRRVAVDDRDGPPHRSHRQRQPQPARRGTRPLARRAGAARPGPGRRHPDRRPGRRPRRRAADVPGGQLQPARLPPGLRPDLRAAPRRACRRPARSRAARPPRRVAAAGDSLFERVRRLAPRPVLGGRRRRHRLRTARRGLDRRGRRPHRPPGDRADRSTS